MSFFALDITAASVFVVCEAFVVTLEVMGKLKHPSKQLKALVTVSDVLAIISLVYIATLRAVPFLYVCIKGYYSL